MTPEHTRPQAEPGSFRDPQTRVFHADGEVLRGLGAQAAQDWKALRASDFFARTQAERTVTRTEEVDRELPGAPGTWSATLRHEPLPFVTYPYEWSHAMRQDAARLHLRLLQDALAAGFTMKDGSAYNVQWRGAAPEFVDVGSFEPARAGEPWAGYRQFCQTLLYPLMLQAHLDLDPRPLLRAQIDGVEPAQMRRMFGGTKRLARGVLKHVHLHDSIQSRNADRSTGAVREQLKDAGFNSELVLAAVKAMAKLVDQLDWAPPATHWGDYRETCSYSEADRAAKQAFVDAALTAAAKTDLVLDLGANDGVFSRQAATRAQHVVAVEADPAVVDTLYRQLRAEGEQRILPIVMDLADPSPGGGWAGTERAGFPQRAARADVTLALALVHHLAIGRNVPLPRVVDWLAGMGRTVVVEFVHAEDPMAQRLLANKPDGLFPDYHVDTFEKLLGERFDIARKETLPGGSRTLIAGVRRD
ncbi:class I SAM-dependent methyltransferase [Asanoa siamensis]|uniref:50S ribosomal protein L11 methyltransferase n=1 Tax=Asanoa siamensis TaxID=926357 RepID=A0ABQ4CL12_9ACTN|nr:class I SAM-dependent methyltransferase [Asanoa siamensis]GIF71971.1 50S ribosomal protein L11 methyltransferase [Asanoa siamensis]